MLSMQNVDKLNFREALLTKPYLVWLTPYFFNEIVMRKQKTSVLSLFLILVCVFSTNIMFAQQNKSDDGGYVMKKTF